jgi:hypothetical protein
MKLPNAQAYARSMMPGPCLSNALRTHARTNEELLTLKMNLPLSNARTREARFIHQGKR